MIYLFCLMSSYIFILILFYYLFFPHCKLWQGRWQGNDIVAKELRVRDWTTRKTRDFNEEYPKLRWLLTTQHSLQLPCLLSCQVTICVFALCRGKVDVFFLFVASHTSCLFLSNPLRVCVFFVCLSYPSFPPPPPPCPPPLGSIPGYFPIRMSSLFWERVCLLPLTLSSSHTGCLTAPSTTSCMKAPVSTFTLVTKPVFLTNFLF